MNPRVDLRLVILFPAALARLPGFLGARVRALREAGAPAEPSGSR